MSHGTILRLTEQVQLTQFNLYVFKSLTLICRFDSRDNQPQLTTDQIVVVRPLEVFLDRAIVQSNPGVIMTQTWRKDTTSQ